MNSFLVQRSVIGLLGIFLSLPTLASHESSYIKLSEKQAKAYPQCNPEKYNHWILVDKKGADLSELIEEIVDQLSEPEVTTIKPPDITTSTTTSTATTSTATTSTATTSTAIAQPSTVASNESSMGFDISPTSTLDDDLFMGETFSSSLIVPTSVDTMSTRSPTTRQFLTPTPDVQLEVGRAKRQAEDETIITGQPRIDYLRNNNRWPPLRSQRSKRGVIPPKPVIENKVLILLDGEDSEPYIMTKSIRQTKADLGLCTRTPSDIAHSVTTPFDRQATIKLEDQNFTNRYSAAFWIDDGMALNIDYVQFDAKGWSSNYPIVLGYERAEINIRESHFVQLKTELGGWTDNYYGKRSIIILDWWDYGKPTLNITNSSFYQGMKFGAILFAKAGGVIKIENTRQIVANGGVAETIFFADLDIIGGLLHGCAQAVSLSSLENLGRLPQTLNEFCQVSSNISKSCGYYGYNNVINLQNVHFSGEWSNSSGAIDFLDDRLKVGLNQNIGNTEAITSGNLCRAELATGAVGAIEISGRLCPQGHQLADSQGYTGSRTLPYESTTEMTSIEVDEETIDMSSKDIEEVTTQRVYEVTQEVAGSGEGEDRSLVSGSSALSTNSLVFTTIMGIAVLKAMYY